MKIIMMTSLVVLFSASYVKAEPGGTYTLTGDEKGISEIIKADMELFSELYKGESLSSYISKFKRENKIGQRKLSAGDQLRFPETLASIKTKKNSKAEKKADSENNEEPQNSPIGKWKTIDFVKTIDQFDPSTKHWRGDLFLLELDFHKRGYVTCSNKKVDEYQQSWTKGKVDPDSEHPAHYSIKEIKGETYLFFQWISGDVTERGEKPHYYVLKKK